jgi:hypothetical protein
MVQQVYLPGFSLPFEKDGDFSLDGFLHRSLSKVANHHESIVYNHLFVKKTGLPSSGLVNYC